MMHENWCEVNQGGIQCDCGEEMTRKQKESYQHKNWCELNQGGIKCDCSNAFKN